MKVFIITNLFPTRENPSLGIFITKRLEQYQKFGIDYTAVSLGFQDRLDVKLLKSMLRKNQNLPLNRLESVKYESVLIPRGFLKAVLGKTRRYEKILKEFLKALSFRFHISKYSLIHAHGMYGIPAGEIAYILSREYSKPFVVTLHGSDINVVIKKRKKRYLEILENASKSIFVSKALLEKAKSFGYSGQNAIVIPNGYDPDIFKPFNKNNIRKKLGIYKDGYKYIGFVGSLTPIKRADKLPEIFHRIHKKIPSTFFIIVGDGYLKNRIERETKGLDILFTGRIPHGKVAEYMNAMDVMVLPSRNEGFGSVVIEAQACGTCVVGSNNGGIPESIGFEECIVEGGKDFEKRLSEKVFEVLQDGYDKDKLIKRVKRFTWENIVIRETEIYKQVG